MAEFIAGKDDEGRRADRLLRRMLEDVSLSFIYAFIRRGSVRVNGKKIKGSEKIHEGDIIEIRRGLEVKDKEVGLYTKKVSPNREASRLPLDILFQNEHILIVNKKEGVLTHGKGSIAEEVERKWREEAIYRKDASLSFIPGPLQRLDKATSGVLFFSQSLAGAKWFTDAIKAHKVKKTYLALLEGEVTKEMQWKDMLSPSGNEKGGGFHTMKIAEGRGGGKEAITSVYPIFSCRIPYALTFVKVIIETGRKHQIRVQCAAHGYPLIGDRIYGSKESSKEGGIYLHCAEVKLPINEIGVPPIINAPLSSKFASMLENIGIGDFYIKSIGIENIDTEKKGKGMQI